MKHKVYFRFILIILSVIFFISCANYLKRRYFKGYHHVKASSQSDFVLNKINKYNLKNLNYDKSLNGSSEFLITSTENGANKNIITKISSEKKNFNVGKQNVNNAHIKDIKKTVTIFNKKNENKNYKEKPEKDIEYYNKKFKTLFVISIVMLILNILLYIINYIVYPYDAGWGCLGCIPIFFYVLFIFVAFFYFIKAIIYIVKFWGKEKPKYFYWFVVLSIFNLLLFFILFNGIFTIFPFLGYLGFL